MPRTDRPDCFLFYPDDFASDGVVEAMSTEAVGCYILLLCKAWRETPPATVPDDDRLLARWTRSTPEKWSELKSEVMAAFTLGTDSRWIQRRLRLEYDKQRQRLNSFASRGAKGAEKRWLKHGLAIAEPLAKPSIKHGVLVEVKDQKQPSAVEQTKASIAWAREAGWSGITDEDRKRWIEAYPACNIDRQLASMAAWLDANPAKAKKTNWPRFIVNWLTKEQQRGGDAKSNRPHSTNPGRIDAPPGKYERFAQRPPAIADPQAHPGAAGGSENRAGAG